MKQLACLVSVVIWSLTAAAPATAGPLDELLETLRSERQRQGSELAEREARFRAARDERETLLTQARATLEDTRRESDRLREAFDANQTRLREQQETLSERTAHLGDLQSVIQQMAADVLAVAGESMSNAGGKDRLEPIALLSRSSELPDVQQLESLWDLMLEEMVASQQVTQQRLPVIGADGIESTIDVLRLGPFTAWAEGRFLRYLPEAGRFLVPLRQPSTDLRGQMARFAADPGAGGIAVIDPTRGALLSLLGQRADLEERVRQGGVIGHVILGLGGLGLLMALLRFIGITRVRRQMERSVRKDEATQGDPLGRLIMVAASNPQLDAEALGLRLDEAVLAEAPRLLRGISFIALLAGIAPLLGLLGTVTGIIETFQSITLYGTGDPRLMSGGISQALVTTVMGLVVAIPMFLLHNLLNERSNELVARLDEQAAGLVAERSARMGTGHA
jgi:biopolymer transport protein ExbB